MLDQIFACPPCPPDAFVHLYTRGGADGAGVPGKVFLPIETAALALPAWAQTARDHKQDLWWRGALHDTDGNVIGVSCLWVDVDNPDDEHAQRVAALPVAPNFTLWSGRRGYHYVWLLDQVYTDLSAITGKLYALAEALHGDMSVAAVHRGLRVPDTFNSKNTSNDPAQYTCRVLETGPPVRRALNEFPGDPRASHGAGGKGRRSKKPTYASFRDLFTKYFPDDASGKAEWVVHCPWHDDQNASLCVNVDEGIFLCQAAGCGVKGTAVKFLAHMEDVSFEVARQTISNLATQGSAVLVVARDLFDLVDPLYREKDRVTVAVRKTGQQTTFAGANRQATQAMLQAVLDGSPAQYVLDTLGEAMPLRSATDIAHEAALALGSGLPERATMTILGQGIHVVDNETLRVDGSTLWRYEPGTGWILVPRHVLHDTVVAHPGREPLPWYPAGSTRGHTIRSVLADLIDVMSPAWVLSHPQDATILCLYTLYLMIWHAFETPLHLQVSAQSQSGKSSLTKGWFCGRVPGSTTMVPGTRYLANTTAAAIYQRFDRSRLPLVLDEVLDYRDSRTQKVIELIRTMEGSDSEIYRGGQHGDPYAYHVCFPTIWSSVHVPDQAQDTNRRLHLEIPHVDPAPKNPWQIIAKNGWTPTRLRGLAAAAQEIMVASIPTLRQIVEHVREELNLRGADGGNYRTAMGCAPLIAIARLCGVPEAPVLERLLGRARETEAEAQEGSTAEDLRQIILHMRIRLANGLGDTSVAQELQAGLRADCNFLCGGLFIWGREKMLGVVCGTFKRVARLDLSTMQIGRQLKHVPGYVKSEPKWAGGACQRFALFSIPQLLAGDRGSRNGKARGLGASSEQPGVGAVAGA